MESIHEEVHQLDMDIEENQGNSVENNETKRHTFMNKNYFMVN